VLAPIVRATVASSLIVGVSMTAAVAAPRTHLEGGDGFTAATTAAVAAPRTRLVGGDGMTAATAASPANDPAGSDAPPTLFAAPAGQDGGDLRSSGEGAGLAGSPLLAIGAVLAIGAGSVAATLIYVRLTAGRGGRR
jgi:hypothetical protein